MASKKLSEEWKQTAHILAAIGGATGNDPDWRSYYPYDED